MVKAQKQKKQNKTKLCHVSGKGKQPGSLELRQQREDRGKQEASRGSSCYQDESLKFIPKHIRNFFR